MAILVEKYIHKKCIRKSGNRYRWFSLVTCEGENHVGNRERLMEFYDAKRCNGAKYCIDCYRNDYSKNHDKRWKKEEDNILKKYFPEKGATGLHEQLLSHRSIHGIRKRAHSLKISFNKRWPDLTNKINGKITAISFYKTDQNKQWLWLCKCECGKELYLRTNSFHKVRSCGCIRSYTGSLSKHFGGYGEISGKVFSGIRATARRQKLDFLITIEYIWDLFLKQNRKCIFSGQTLTFPKSSKEKQCGMCTASLDRIDSSKGYIEGNVQWIHKYLNVMKQDMTDKEFIKWCKIVTEYNK